MLVTLKHLPQKAERLSPRDVALRKEKRQVALISVVWKREEFGLGLGDVWEGE